MNKDILILGGARYHGLQLAEYFCSAGNRVFVLNRGKYRKNYNSKIKHLVADRDNEEHLSHILKDYYFDMVIDNNAYTPVQIETILDVIHDRCNHYVFTSTAAVYLALSSNHKLKESEDPGILDKPFCPKIKEYALNKYASEKRLQQRALGLNYTIIRLPNIFGEGDFLGKMFYFYTRLKDGGNILLEKEVNRFNLIYIKDVLKVYNAVAGNEKCYGKIFNACDPEPYNYNVFFSTVYGDIYSKEKIILMPAKMMWDAGYFLPLAWGPMIDATLSTEIIGDIRYTPLNIWGESALEWETENFKEREKEAEYIQQRELELSIIERHRNDKKFNY